MGRKSNYSIEEKVQAVLDYKNGAIRSKLTGYSLVFSERNICI